MSDPSKNETQPSLAPSWLPRRQRRPLNKILDKLADREACSVCGSDWKHNSRTAYGLDSSGGIVVAGECCLDRVAIPLGYGFFSERRYDFLNPRVTPREPGVSPARRPETREQIAEAIALYQKAIAAADKQVEDFERHGDVEFTGEALLLLDHPWKTDDRAWFEHNPQRSHRVRIPFTGEFDDLGAKAPAGHALIILVRQARPGTRLRCGFYFNTALLPVPDDEALIHAIFEIAARREPVPGNMQALNALREKYVARSSC
jgi:hypothetical protein